MRSVDIHDLHEALEDFISSDTFSCYADNDDCKRAQDAVNFIEELPDGEFDDWIYDLETHKRVQDGTTEEEEEEEEVTDEQLERIMKLHEGTQRNA